MWAGTVNDPMLRIENSATRCTPRLPCIALDCLAGLGVVGELLRWMYEKSCRPQTSGCLRAGVRGRVPGEMGRALWPCAGKVDFSGEPDYLTSQVWWVTLSVVYQTFRVAVPPQTPPDGKTDAMNLLPLAT